MTDSEWLTWDEAAELVGCPVSTIDWYKRQGRIVSRGRHAASLQRASVEAFATWWAEREAARAERRAARSAPANSSPPESTGWLSTREVADLLGVSTAQVAHLIRQGRLPATRRGQRFWVPQAAAEQLVAERSQWVSLAEAADIIGVNRTTVAARVRAGLIEQRPEHGRRASLSRASVEAYAEVHRAEQEQRQAARARRQRPTGPPDDGGVWFDANTAALVLGLSPQRVRQLGAAGNLPSTEHGGRRWYARHHVEQRAAARALARGRGPVDDVSTTTPA